MRRFLFTLVGMVFLVVAAVLFWTALGPRRSVERTTGGVLTTQAELAGQAFEVAGAEPVLPVIVDGQQVDTNVVGPPQLAPEAASDVASLDQEEAEAAPQVAATFVPGVTTDVVVDENTEIAVAPLALEDGRLPEGQGGAGALGVVEQRVVEMEWPASFRVGGAGALRITLKPLAGGALQPVAEIGTNEVLATPIILSDRYDAYDATVTATISAPDFDVEATTPETQTLTRGGEVTWRWTLKPSTSGQPVIVLNIAITWTPKAGGTPITEAIWGHSVQVEANYVFGGLTVPQASIFATVLAVIGFFGQVPLLERLLEMLLFGGRRRRRRAASTSRRRR